MQEPLIVIGIGVLLIICGFTWLKKIKGKKLICTSSCEGEIAGISKSIKSDEAGDTMMYSPVFNYNVEGVSYTKESTISSSRCKYNKGDKIMVFYNPQNPDQYYVKGNNSNIFMAVVVLFVGIVMIIIGFSGDF